eukprot:TRINITY_DN25954_c0_g1_i2.p1 TRINITY_DN25954_c0_g1~~TRINITY_DN25954_c0_g1_i2.p1  ORF type:complete len:476 (-),score=93.79 TRINITY_DN25954_c0_g1_i2:103-1530(-)
MMAAEAAEAKARELAAQATSRTAELLSSVDPPVEDIRSLSVKQLKRRLEAHGVPHSDVVEKEELVSRLRHADEGIPHPAEPAPRVPEPQQSRQSQRDLSPGARDLREQLLSPQAPSSAVSSGGNGSSGSSGGSCGSGSRGELLGGGALVGSPQQVKSVESELESKAGFLHPVDSATPSVPAVHEEVSDRGGRVEMEKELAEMRETMAQQQRDTEELHQRLFGTIAGELQTVKDDLARQKHQAEAHQAERSAMVVQLGLMEEEVAEQKQHTGILANKLALAEEQLAGAGREKAEVVQELESCRRALADSEKRIRKLLETKCSECRLMDCKDDLTRLSERLSTSNDPFDTPPKRSDKGGQDGCCCPSCSQPLTEFRVTARGKFICDVCNQPITNGATSLQCSRCDFDACDKCGRSGVQMIMTPPRVPRPVSQSVSQGCDRPGILPEANWSQPARPASPRRLEFETIMNLAGENRHIK